MEKEKIVIALKKAHTHLGNIVENIENEKECFLVLQQTLAVIGLLKSANQMMLERHIERVMRSAKGLSENKRKELCKELLKTMRSVK